MGLFRTFTALLTGARRSPSLPSTPPRDSPATLLVHKNGASLHHRPCPQKLAYLAVAAALAALTFLLLVLSGRFTALYWRLQDVPFILYYKLLHPRPSNKPLLVPRHIYQTWYTRQLHPSAEHKLTRLRLANPHYAYTLFTDDEMHAYVRGHFAGDIATAYARLTIVTAQADFWRYLVLYREGGIYLDMDGGVVG